MYRERDSKLHSIGLGDGLNDAPFLQIVDTPAIIRSHSSSQLRKLIPRAMETASTGPAGWNQAILEFFQR
jgi:mannosyl-3-phosphoglycerate phosphatase